MLKCVKKMESKFTFTPFLISHVRKMRMFNNFVQYMEGKI